MLFFSIFLFIFCVYIRPHELNPVVDSLRPIRLAAGLGIIGMIREKGGWRKFLFSFHDVFMIAYIWWIAHASPPFRETFSEVNKFLVFYFMSAIGLNTTRRMRSYMSFWALMILALAIMAILPQYGFDINDSERLRWVWKDRIAFNTSIFINPNALGHAIVPWFPLAYYIWFWKRGPHAMFLAVAGLFPILYCIWLTVSKGAFVSSAAALFSTLVFGKKIWIQLIIGFFAFQIIAAGLAALPRMGSVMSGGKASEKDEGIRGRIHAFTFGWKNFETDRRIGYKKFSATIEAETGWRKSSHCAYVEVGSELGKTGLFLFTSLLYLGFSTLFRARCALVKEERIRRALFGVMIAYIVSCWMVTFTYRPWMFLQLGVIAAFHRYLSSRGESKDYEDHSFEIPKMRVSVKNATHLVSPVTSIPAFAGVERTSGYSFPSTAVSLVLNRGSGLRGDWKYMLVVDAVLMVVFFRAVVSIWEYAVLNF